MIQSKASIPSDEKFGNDNEIPDLIANDPILENTEENEESPTKKNDVDIPVKVEFPPAPSSTSPPVLSPSAIQTHDKITTQ